MLPDEYLNHLLEQTVCPGSWISSCVAGECSAFNVEPMLENGRHVGWRCKCWDCGGTPAPDSSDVDPKCSASCARHECSSASSAREPNTGNLICKCSDCSGSASADHTDPGYFPSWFVAQCRQNCEAHGCDAPVYGNVGSGGEAGCACNNCGGGAAAAGLVLARPDGSDLAGDPLDTRLALPSLGDAGFHVLSQQWSASLEGTCAQICGEAGCGYVIYEDSEGRIHCNCTDCDGGEVSGDNFPGGDDDGFTAEVFDSGSDSGSSNDSQDSTSGQAESESSDPAESDDGPEYECDHDELERECERKHRDVEHQNCICMGCTPEFHGYCEGLHREVANEGDTDEVCECGDCDEYIQGECDRQNRVVDGSGTACKCGDCKDGLYEACDNLHRVPDYEKCVCGPCDPGFVDWCRAQFLAVDDTGAECKCGSCDLDFLAFICSMNNKEVDAAKCDCGDCTAGRVAECDEKDMFVNPDTCECEGCKLDASVCAFRGYPTFDAQNCRCTGCTADQQRQCTENGQTYNWVDNGEPGGRCECLGCSNADREACVDGVAVWDEANQGCVCSKCTAAQKETCAAIFRKIDIRTCLCTDECDPDALALGCAEENLEPDYDSCKCKPAPESASSESHPESQPQDSKDSGSQDSGSDSVDCSTPITIYGDVSASTVSAFRDCCAANGKGFYTDLRGGFGPEVGVYMRCEDSPDSQSEPQDSQSEPQDSQSDSVDCSSSRTFRYTDTRGQNAYWACCWARGGLISGYAIPDGNNYEAGYYVLTCSGGNNDSNKPESNPPESWSRPPESESRPPESESQSQSESTESASQECPPGDCSAACRDKCETDGGIWVPNDETGQCLCVKQPPDSPNNPNNNDSNGGGGNNDSNGGGNNESGGGNNDSGNHGSGGNNESGGGNHGSGGGGNNDSTGGNNDSNPPESKDSNPPESKDSNPPESKDSNPPESKESNPPESKESNPPESKESNPPESKESNPPESKDSNPPESKDSNSVGGDSGDSGDSGSVDCSGTGIFSDQASIEAFKACCAANGKGWQSVTDTEYGVTAVRCVDSGDSDSESGSASDPCDTYSSEDCREKCRQCRRDGGVLIDCWSCVYPDSASVDPGACGSVNKYSTSSEQSRFYECCRRAGGTVCTSEEEIPDVMDWSIGDPLIVDPDGVDTSDRSGLPVFRAMEIVTTYRCCGNKPESSNPSSTQESQPPESQSQPPESNDSNSASQESNSASQESQESNSESQPPPESASQPPEPESPYKPPHDSNNTGDDNDSTPQDSKPQDSKPQDSKPQESNSTGGGGGPSPESSTPQQPESTTPESGKPESSKPESSKPESNPPESKESNPPESKESNPPDSKESNPPDSKESNPPDSHDNASVSALESISNPSSNKDSNPASKQDSNPSSKQDSNPASNQDSNPSSNQDSNPSSNQDSNPSSKQDSNPASKQDSNPSSNQESGSHQDSQSESDNGCSAVGTPAVIGTGMMGDPLHNAFVMNSNLTDEQKQKFYECCNDIWHGSLGWKPGVGDYCGDPDDQHSGDPFESVWAAESAKYDSPDNGSGNQGSGGNNESGDNGSGGNHGSGGGNNESGGGNNDSTGGNHGSGGNNDSTGGNNDSTGGNHGSGGGNNESGGGNNDSTGGNHGSGGNNDSTGGNHGSGGNNDSNGGGNNDSTGGNNDSTGGNHGSGGGNNESGGGNDSGGNDSGGNDSDDGDSNSDSKSACEKLRDQCDAKAEDGWTWDEATCRCGADCEGASAEDKDRLSADCSTFGDDCRLDEWTDTDADGNSRAKCGCRCGSNDSNSGDSGDSDSQDPCENLRKDCAQAEGTWDAATCKCSIPCDGMDIDAFDAACKKNGSGCKGYGLHIDSTGKPTTCVCDCSAPESNQESESNHDSDSGKNECEDYDCGVGAKIEGATKKPCCDCKGVRCVGSRRPNPNNHCICGRGTHVTLTDPNGYDPLYPPNFPYEPTYPWTIGGTEIA